MKKHINKLVMALAILTVSAITYAFIPTANNPTNEIEIGGNAPGTTVNLEDFKGAKSTMRNHLKENGLLVIFSCNTCPFVVAWEDRYNELYDFAQKNKIGMILVNSNEAKRDKDDSIDAMKKHAAEKGYKMPYLLDKNHALADAFGARTTPHVFLFNKEMKLAYKGAIDDNYEDKSKVKSTYLQDAMQAMASGKNIETNTTKAIGCSIKRMKS